MDIHLYQYIVYVFILFVKYEIWNAFYFAEFLDCSSTFERAAAMIILAIFISQMEWKLCFAFLITLFDNIFKLWPLM